MKAKIVMLILIVFNCTYNKGFSQSYEGAFYEMFFGIQPSARAEAMGRSIVSIPGDANSYYYNPAGSAALNGMNINGSGTEQAQYNLYSKATTAFGGASWKFGKTVTLGLSFDIFNTGEYDLSYIANSGDTVSGKFNTQVQNYRLTVASEVYKNLFAGLNLNIFVPDKNFGYLPFENGNENDPVMYFDLGLLKSYNFGSKDKMQDLNFGASVINLNSAGYYYSDRVNKGKLPLIFRIGSSYNILLNKTFNFLFNTEYEDVINSKYYEGIHTGFEFSLRPFLYLRAGYFLQDVPGTGMSGHFTYGAGINPLFLGYLAGMESGHKIKFQLIFDYSRVTLTSILKDKQDNDKFNLFSLTLIRWF